MAKVKPRSNKNKSQKVAKKTHLHQTITNLAADL